MFSTKAEYGVRIMAHLAAHDGDGPVSLSAIAEAEGLPLAYLEHLVQRLRKASLVESTRGAHGGYRLAREASDITMAEVVEALEGEIAPIECISADPDGQLVCSREATLDRVCPTKVLWTRVQGSIVRTLRDISLNELVVPTDGSGADRRARSKQGKDAGSRNSRSAIPATEDAAMRSFAAAGRGGTVGRDH